MMDLLSLPFSGEWSEKLHGYHCDRTPISQYLRHRNHQHASGFKFRRHKKYVKLGVEERYDDRKIEVQENVPPGKMGKSARAAASLLEKVLQFLYKTLQVFILIVLKTIKNGPRQELPAPSNTQLLHLSATSLATKIRRREITCLQVIETFINRTKEINPLLNCIVQERFEEARREAKQVDAFLKQTKQSEKEIETSQPFLGVPLTVKESLAVQGMPHTAGVISRKDIIAKEHASVVSCMTKAGAIIIAVTNTPEVCCWWETYNPLHGRTSNPYDTTRSAGGSSGGEGAVIAAAGSVIGIGSDFAGSIRVPAAFNGIFGHRPTSLTSPIDGHYPIPANTHLRQMLNTGPLTRYATDLRPIVKVITKDLAPSLDLFTHVDLKNLTVYYLEDCDMFLTTSVQPSIKEAVRKTAQHFQSLGAKTEEVKLKGMKYAMMYWYATVKTDDGPQLGKELANHQGAVSIATEFFKSLVGASKHTLPIILFGALESGNGIPYKGTLHSAVLRKCEQFKEELKSMLGENSVLILPTHPTTALKHREAIARSMDLGYAAVFNVLGYPSTVCPITKDHKGLPVAVQVVAKPNQDRITLAVAEEIERAFGGWIPPYSDEIGP